MEKTNKRKRSSNWIEEDKSLLKCLVKNRVAEVEDKNTDTNTNQRKKRAWLYIEKRFNKLCRGASRNVIQLKSQWTLMKIQAKKELGSQNKALSNTGDEQQQALDKTLFANDLSAWLPHDIIHDTNEFDSDGIVSDVSRAVDNSNEGLIVPERELEIKLETDSIAEFEEDHEELPEVSQEKVYKKKKKMPTTNQSFANTKIRKLADLEVKCREELHLLQMENERKKARNLDLEYELLQEKFKFFKRKMDDMSIRW